MFKVLLLARRTSQVTPTQFAELFEARHVPAIRKMVDKGTVAPMVEYRRNYIQHGHELGTVQEGELDFDVVIECVFASREDCEFARSAAQRDPELSKMLAEDLSRYLDRSSLRYLVVETKSGGADSKVEE
jgi:hypothetical protein